MFVAVGNVKKITYNGNAFSDNVISLTGSQIKIRTFGILVVLPHSRGCV